MRIQATGFQPANPRGFIVLEGVNGAGKSTLLRSLTDGIQAMGCAVVTTREPGATELGRTLRSILLEGQMPRGPLAELFLFAADRAEHVRSVITPALEAGSIVISDRYYYSTVAFQGYGRRMNLPEVLSINQIAVAGCVPDLVILLDMDPLAALRRAAQRDQNGDSDQRDAFESEVLDFHYRVRAGFLELADTLPEPFLVLDAAQPPEQLCREAFAAVRSVVEGRS